MKTLKNLGYLLGLPVLLILIWWAATLESRQLLRPDTREPGRNLRRDLARRAFFTDVLPSIGRLAVGRARRRS